MLTTARRTAKVLATAAVPASLLFAGATAGATAAAASPVTSGAAAQHAVRHGAAPQYWVRQILNGKKLRHTFVPAGSAKRRSEPLADPDDITVLGHHLYTAFQNGIGPQGQASTDGNTDSTVVEYTAAGHVLHQWDIHGKCDGITADTGRHLLIATVNEDANSSVYTITPGAPAAAQIEHYHYSQQPLPHNGGTDAISIYHGQVLISASAPGTKGKAAPQPTYPAAYSVTFDPATRIAKVKALFYDEAAATVANVGPDQGTVVRLALTDPDSNEIVPNSGPRFAGDFMLTSQGDKEQIFVRAGWGGQRLSVLRLSQSVERHGLGPQPGGSPVRRRHERGHGGRGDRPLPGAVHLCRRHTLRRRQRARHLPGARIPAQLPGPAEPVERAHHPGAGPWPRFRAAGHGVRQPRLGRHPGLTPG